MRRLETGVFLPNARNGFMFSANAYPYEPAYEENLDITLLAEELGLDYVFSMAKWIGFGGSTGFWDAQLESFTLMSALAAVTSRIRLIATVTPPIFHPTLVSKMSATADRISRGRFGLNIVTGAFLGEYAQMGVVPPGYDQDRYGYATEWVEILKRLWTEPSVTHHGKYFHLENCLSEPKPIQQPHPFLVCAAASEAGIRFTAREAQYSFVSEVSSDAMKDKALRIKEIAAEEGTTLKTQVLAMLVIGQTREQAKTSWDELVNGADLTACTNAGIALVSEDRESAKELGRKRLTDERRIALGVPIVGGPEEVAEELIGLAVDGDVDGVLMCFPHYLDGLRRFGSGVMPILRQSLNIGAVK